MTVERLREEMSSYEFQQWLIFLKVEAAEQKRRKGSGGGRPGKFRE